MIADDVHDIREGMRKLAQARVQAEAEAAKRAEADAKPTDLPTPKPLFSESAPPFRGFFVTEDGDIVPHGDTPSEAGWAGWIDTQEGNLSVITTDMIKSEVITDIQLGVIRSGVIQAEDLRSSPPAVQAANRASNRFTFWGYRGEDPDGQ